MIARILSHRHTIPLFLFFTFTTVFFCTTVGILNSSDASQYALVRALIEEKTIKINNFLDWTYPDIALNNGNSYSVRTVGESLFMIPFHLWGKLTLPFTRFPYDDTNHPGINDQSKLESLTTLTNAVFGAGVIVLIYIFSFNLTSHRLASIITAITLGLGSLLWRYSSYFQRHPIAIFFYLLSFTLVTNMILIRRKERKASIINTLSIGFFLGLAFITDYAYLLIIAFLLIYILLFLIINKYKIIHILVLFFSFLLPLSVYFFYNYSAFNNPFKFSNLYFTKPHFQNPSDFYTLPILPSLLVNVFNDGPIPKYTFPEDLRNNHELNEYENASMQYALKYSYKGIFSQSPILYLCIMGFLLFWKKTKFPLFLILIPPILFIIQTSRLTFFYGPNSYDSHYFLLAIPFLFVGFALWIHYLCTYKNHILIKSLLAILTIRLVIISIYNGWYSTITNYGPHLTSEHRYSPDTALQEISNLVNLKNNFYNLFINTFPNIYNLPLLFFFFICPVFLIYLLHRTFSYLVTKDE